MKILELFSVAAIGTKWPSGISGVLSTRPNKQHCKSYKGHRFEYID